MTRKSAKPAWDKDVGAPGLIHVYTGDGKGKTTAAVGLVVRAVGHRLRCCFVQFMKGRYPYGEVRTLRKLKGVTVRQFGTLEFVHKDRARAIDRMEARKALAFGGKALASGSYDIVVLDEVCVAVFMGLIPVDDVIAVLEARSPKVEVIMTGRRAHKRLLSRADYVTRFGKAAHPYDKGVLARKGIEY